MNKDELIKLKEQLMKATPSAPTKRYGYFDTADGWHLDYETEYEIISEINMQSTIKKFETILEYYVKWLVSKKIDFEKIKIIIDPNIYASEEYLVRYDEAKMMPELAKDDVLYDVIPLSFNLVAYDSNGYMTGLQFRFKDDAYFDYMMNDIFGTTVIYSEFVKLLEQLGYDISLKNFDEYFVHAFEEEDYDAEIIIDFAKEKNQNHTM